MSSHLYGSGYTSRFPDNTHAYLWQPVLRSIASLPKGARILDAGCGNGYFSNRLYEAGFDVTGVDAEASGIAAARQLWQGLRFEETSVYDDLTWLGAFDAVVSMEVVEHLYDPRRFVARVRECLKPDGILVLTTPYHGWLKNTLIAASGSFDSHVSPLWDGGHIKFWSRDTLRRLLQEVGFRVNAIRGAGRLPWIWKSMIAECVAPQST